VARPLFRRSNTWVLLLQGLVSGRNWICWILACGAGCSCREEYLLNRFGDYLELLELYPSMPPSSVITNPRMKYFLPFLKRNLQSYTSHPNSHLSLSHLSQLQCNKARIASVPHLNSSATSRYISQSNRIVSSRRSNRTNTTQNLNLELKTAEKSESQWTNSWKQHGQVSSPQRGNPSRFRREKIDPPRKAMMTHMPRDPTEFDKTHK
jgi:hypothetical protein